jgi:hypothetical protein
VKWSGWRGIGGALVLLLAGLVAGGWGGYPLQPAPGGQSVLAGRAYGSPPYMFVPLVCWSRRSGFESGPACDGIVPVGALFPTQKLRYRRVRATEPWTCPQKAAGARPADQRRTALRLEWRESSRVGYHDPGAWPPAVAATIVGWFEFDADDSPRAIDARAARLADLAQRAAEILPPENGWKPDRETDFDIDGDGRPERFMTAHRPVGSGRAGDCPRGESALVVSWGGRWVGPPQSPDIDRNWPGWWHAEGGEPPLLLEIGPIVHIEAAVDLDGDGRRELLIGGWMYHDDCDREQGRWTLLRLDPGHAEVVARWDECGRPLGASAPAGRNAW